MQWCDSDMMYVLCRHLSQCSDITVKGEASTCSQRSFQANSNVSVLHILRVLEKVMYKPVTDLMESLALCDELFHTFLKIPVLTASVWGAQNRVNTQCVMLNSLFTGL